MTLTITQSFIIILVIASITFLTRIIPFILFPDHKETPEYITYLGNVIPYSAIGMLVVYCLKEVSFKTMPFGLPEFISILVIMVLHRWKKSTLMSIGSGTLLYMLMVQGLI